MYITLLGKINLFFLELVFGNIKSTIAKTTLKNTRKSLDQIDVNLRNKIIL